MLADGCTVPACTGCHEMIDKGKKILQEKGEYYANPIRGGDSMTKVEKKSEGGNYLKREFVEQREITSLKIETEGESVEFENKDKNGEMKKVSKWQIGVSYDGQKDDDPNVWTMNNTSFNACIDLFEDDTAKWIGKTVDITIGGEGEMKHIKVDVVRSKKRLS